MSEAVIDESPQAECWWRVTQDCAGIAGGHSRYPDRPICKNCERHLNLACSTITRLSARLA